ncbi:MAG: succinylglutamate desuccinylase/aspartoacylase family protein [Kangiellaceae bacterium]|nr:succinylglutamate desuccinylase/aspartoacylase family protein [Kangiellaceae bacterium]
MSFLNPEITYYDNAYRKIIPDTLLGFLRSLDGLTVIDIAGHSNHWRVVTTLIHGNEPSGLIACHLWLKSDHIPATNIRLIFCNPEAAKTKPFFTNRYIQHSADLNRFFQHADHSNSEVRVRARNITTLVNEVVPEAIVDLHNTSGASSAFCVSVSESPQHLDLASLFTERLILTQLNVGAIMEQSFGAPIVTIECGGSDENESHRVASEGLYKYFDQQELFNKVANKVNVLRHPVRIELTEDASVGFSTHRLTTTDITLRADIEILNRKPTVKEEFIGWCKPDTAFSFCALDDQGINRIDELFENRNGCIFSRIEMQLFMATAVAEIATKDCLFYTTVTD